MHGVPQILAGLNEYELRHLPNHLASGELDNDLNALLALGAESTDSVCNAWFAAKEAIGDAEGYATDVALAARTAKGKVAAAVAAGRAAPEIGLEVRYVLIGSALTSLTVNPPGEFLVELVKQGRWSAGQALANVRRQPNAHTRGRALAMLSDLVGAAEQRKALQQSLASVAELAPDSRDPWHLANERASVLVLLADRLPNDLLPAAFSLAGEINDTNGRCRALTALATRISEDQRRVVIRDALDALDPGAASVSTAFELLGQTAPDDLLNEIVKKALAISHPFQRSESLITILDRLDSAARASVIADVRAERGLDDEQRLKLLARAGRYLAPESLHQLFAHVPAVTFSGERFELWAALLAVLPADDRKAALDAALRDADGINPESAQYAVEEIAKILPFVPAGERRNALMTRAIEGLRGTQDNAKQDALAQLAPLLAPQLLDSALEAARSFGNEEYFWSLHARAMIAFGQVEQEALEPAELKHIIARAQQMKSDQNRRYVLGAVARGSAADEPQIESAGRTSEAKRLAQRAVLRTAARSLLPRNAATLLARWRKTENRLYLEKLGPRLRRDLGRKAIEVACASDDHFLTGRLLTQLVGYLDRQDQEAVADLVLTLNEPAVATFVADFVDYMAADRIGAAVAIARRFQDRTEGAQVLSALMRRLEGTKRSAHSTTSSMQPSLRRSIATCSRGTRSCSVSGYPRRKSNGSSGSHG